jgi:PHD/YefM family antitoxin component YafN of YafNO toxin-antitoxin module
MEVTMMPRIIPIRELKNTNNISELCRSTNEPIFVTKNGYGELVVMSMETYEEQLRRLEFYQELAISEKQFDEGKYKEARTALSELRAKYAL